MEAKQNKICLKCYVTPEERDLIEEKMTALGTTNRSAFLRKMALDGYVVDLDLPELRELLRLMRYSSNNLNQLTRRVHETGRVYDADLANLHDEFGRLADAANAILRRFSAL